MKKTVCLNSELSYVIAKLGHFDTLCIGDSGLPVPRQTQRIDLAVKAGVPSFYDVFDAVSSEMKVQKVYAASESQTANPLFFEFIRRWSAENQAELVLITHDDLKQMTRSSAAVVRSGECRPYCNVILESGVTF